VPQFPRKNLHTPQKPHKPTWGMEILYSHAQIWDFLSNGLGGGSPSWLLHDATPRSKWPSGAGVSFTGRQVRRPTFDRARVLEETLFPFASFHCFQLLADESADWHASPARLLLEPAEKIVCNSNCEPMTHLLKV
jgi:hypothetical protein